jgi:hypothetical protein
MGLGPPVCEKCRVVVEYFDTRDHYWVCQYCGNKKPQWNAWDCGLTQEELEDNLRFLKFVKGIEDAPTIRGSDSAE